jgi:FkbM family methyltransferase
MRFLRKLLPRLLLWFKILRMFKGLTFGSVLNLWISAIGDVILYVFSSIGFNPRLLLNGLFYYNVKGLGFIVVRGGTDDLYYMIPGREGDVDSFVRSCLDRGSVFVDVGANIGYYTLVASKLIGSSGRVYAIEPIPQTITILKANVKINECFNVIVHEKAAWSSRDKLTLKIPGKWYGLVSAFRNGVNIIVDATTLDELLQAEDQIDCIKIDVEGAELRVLQGAKKVLKRTRYIILELSRDIKEILRELQGSGFKCEKARFSTYIICRQNRFSVKNYFDEL